MRAKLCGFALAETMVALLIVAMASMLVVRDSGANAVVRAQWAAKVRAARLAAELADWTRRGGEQALGMPLAQALVDASQPALLCHDGTCDAAQGAWHHLFVWQTRLRRAVPGARVVICIDDPPTTATAAWACDPAGQATVLKLGWPSYLGAHAVRPMLAIELGPAA